MFYDIRMHRSTQPTCYMHRHLHSSIQHKVCICTHTATYAHTTLLAHANLYVCTCLGTNRCTTYVSARGPSADGQVSLPHIATPPNIECASPALVPQAPHHHPETKTTFLTVQNVLPMAHTANRQNWRYDLTCGISYCEDVIKASVVNDVRPLLLCDARRSLPRYADRSIVRNWWPSRIHTWPGLHCCNSKSRAWAGTAEAAVAGTRSRLLFEVALDQVGSSHKTL